MLITRITRYCEDDPEFEGDYTEVILKRGDTEIARFGDSYHDRGFEKSEGFIQGLRFIHEVDVVEAEVADYLC